MCRTYKSWIDRTSEYGIKCKQLLSCNHVQCRWTAPAKVLALYSCLVVTIKTVACWWRSCFIMYPANFDSHNICSLSFHKVWGLKCWKECLSHLVESLRVVGHHALQLLVDGVYPLVRWAVNFSNFGIWFTCMTPNLCQWKPLSQWTRSNT